MYENTTSIVIYFVHTIGSLSTFNLKFLYLHFENYCQSIETLKLFNIFQLWQRGMGN